MKGSQEKSDRVAKQIDSGYKGHSLPMFRLNDYCLSKTTKENLTKDYCKESVCRLWGSIFCTRQNEANYLLYYITQDRSSLKLHKDGETGSKIVQDIFAGDKKTAWLIALLH